MKFLLKYVNFNQAICGVDYASTLVPIYENIKATLFMI